MAKYLIKYSAGNSFKLEEEDGEIIEASSYDDAIKEAWEAAIQEVESYGGLHGYPYYGDCQECDGSGEDYDGESCTECEGAGSFTWDEFIDQCESWIAYSAEKIDD